MSLTVTAPRLATMTPVARSDGRMRATLRACGRAVVAGLATENGWCWVYGVWSPHIVPLARSRSRDHRP